MTVDPSTANLEVEIKFRVVDASALCASLPALEFRLETQRTFEHNMLFDTPERTLRTSGQTLRIRQYGSRWILTHKATPASAANAPHKHRVETETTVADGAVLAQIFSNLGYSVAFVYEKWRTEYSDGKGHLVLDETPIGTFAELEGPSGWIDATAARLGVAAQEYITANYARLFLEWKKAMGSVAENMTFAEVAAGASR
ncbi:MAG TPA: class IV adenylate cyclase [Acidobacteriaceae bacterium]|nr:class IV adenylate cyclase [Acidobacteriaceae bacterium]